MSDFERISKNSIYSFLSIFFRLFSNVILFWLIARFYGKEIFGQFTIAQTFASVYVIFADFGLDILLTTELPRNVQNSVNIFRKYFSIKFIFSIVAFIILISISFFGSFSENVEQLILIFSFYAAFTTITNFLYALFKGNERLEYETKVSFIVNTSTLVIILYLIILKHDILIIAVAFAFMRLLGLLIALYYSYQVLPSISFRLDLSGFRDILNTVIVFGLFLIFGNLFFQLDTILMSFLTTEEMVGLYQSVFRFTMLPLLIPTILVNSTMPALSRLNAIDIEKWNKLGYLMNKLLVILAIPVSIGLLIYSEELILLVYGAEYLEAVPILKLFAMIVFIRFFAETYGLMLTTSKRQKIRMYIVIAATLLNLIINLYLIPHYGAYGAAVTSFITNLFVAILYLVFTKSFIKNWTVSFINFRFLILIIVVAGLCWVFSLTGYWYMGIVPLAAYYYYIFIKVLSDSEREYIKEFKLLRPITLFGRN